MTGLNKCRLKKTGMILLAAVFLSLSGCSMQPAGSSISQKPDVTQQTGADTGAALTAADIPEYTGESHVVIGDNKPRFSDEELTVSDYESYSELDELGRCGAAQACVGTDLMPTAKRGEIGMIRPSGWHTVKYDVVDGNYLYNRCHLIAYQLSGENANEKNLITGTRYMNVTGMLPFEEQVGDYVRETDNHVMYRVTPVYDGDDLLARGVEMEGYSVEDEGAGICFHVFVYNVQPGIGIDYATGDSWLAEETAQQQTTEETYVLNTNTGKFHRSDCASVAQIAGRNKKYTSESRETLIAEGYSPCGNCKP